MINVKPVILQVLENNPTLISLLGGNHIYQTVAPEADEFPRITFFEMSNFGSVFADDIEIGSEIHVQIDVWSKGSTSSIASEVDKTLKSISFQRNMSIDLYEDDTKIFHKAMRFSTNKIIEEA